MTEERRESERVRAALPARWEGVLAGSDGSVADLSQTGCFVVTGAEVRPHELIRLEIETESGRRLYLWGEVVYRIDEIGFALRFTDTGRAEQQTLASLIASVRGRDAKKE